MGKYGNSPIHANFSEWHYQKCKRDAWLTDIDRLWVEVRDNRIVAVFDLKYSGNIDKPTRGEIIVANFFEKCGIPFYIVYCTQNFDTWIIYRHLTRSKKTLTEQQMIEWINNNLKEWK